MPSYSYGRFAHTVDRMIRKYGYHEASTLGRMFLRRAGLDRECRGVQSDFGPRDIDGSLVQRTDIKFIVSSKTLNGPLDPPPDEEQDVVVLIGNEGVDESSETVLIFAGRPKVLSPAGVILFYELHLRTR